MLLSFLIIILGLIAGSFISAFTYRIPRGISMVKGRSKCPNCKKKISWYDNIPVFSYIFLKGRCRNCTKKISLRYPLIEIGTAFIFFLLHILFLRCNYSYAINDLCIYSSSLSYFTLPYLFLISSAFLVVFITDFEFKVILDEVLFFLLAIVFFVSLLFLQNNIWAVLLSGFGASVILLIIHLVTYGKGMGLGDVKLALLGGFILGWPNSVIWLFLSFLIGAIVGVGLVSAKRTKFGKQIAFGPFLVVSFFIVLVWGSDLVKLLFPF